MNYKYFFIATFTLLSVVKSNSITCQSKSDDILNKKQLIQCRDLYRDTDWIKLPEEELNFCYEDVLYKTKVRPGIRNVFRYFPNNIDAKNKPIVLMVIHGTGFGLTSGPLNEQYFNENNETFKSILDFAKKFADKKKAPIEVASFRWSGQNLDSKRKLAGRCLGHILNTIYKNFDILTLSHSHGGNVVNIASNYLTDITIKYMIHMATPIRDQKDKSVNKINEYSPNNCDNLISFYSTGDWVVPIGALSDFSSIYNLPRRSKFHHKLNNKNIYNIRLLIDSEECGHSDFIDVVPAILDNTLKVIDKKYKHHRFLDMNVSKINYGIQLSIRYPIEETDYYNEFLKNDLRELEMNNLELYKKIKKEIEREKIFSAIQETKFKKLYNKEMHNTDSLFKQMQKYICQKFITFQSSAKYIAFYLYNKVKCN